MITMTPEHVEDTHVYTDRQIAELLPTMWNEEARLNPKMKPVDPEMPKGPSGDPSHKGDHMAHCADISQAWKRTLLSLRQRQVLLMRYGLNWTQQEVADYFGTSQPAIAVTEKRAINNIKTFLNGTAGEEIANTYE